VITSPGERACAATTASRLGWAKPSICTCVERIDGAETSSAAENRPLAES
jgi:hypothetical protein